jgi:excisionase family DNA binding protein
MPRTRKQPQPDEASAPADNGSPALGEVLTLAEAAAYLRVGEAEVLRSVHEQGLPARQLGAEWRFSRAAIQHWLSQPLPKYSKEAQLDVAGIFKDDPTLVPMVEEIYRRRGRPITEDGSYNLLHGLKSGSSRDFRGGAVRATRAATRPGGRPCAR